MVAMLLVFVGTLVLMVDGHVVHCACLQCLSCVLCHRHFAFRCGGGLYMRARGSEHCDVVSAVGAC